LVIVDYLANLLNVLRILSVSLIRNTACIPLKTLMPLVFKVSAVGFALFGHTSLEGMMLLIFILI